MTDQFQNSIPCVLPPTLQPFSWTFLFCYKITSEPIGIFQAHITIPYTNKLINLYPYFFFQI